MGRGKGTFFAGIGGSTGELTKYAESTQQDRMEDRRLGCHRILCFGLGPQQHLTGEH